MRALICPGLPASWVNAWLAGVGMTVLDCRIRLHWTEEDAPVAVLSAAEIDPIAALVESWPGESFLSELPIAESWHGDGELKRKVSVDQFAARVQKARGHPQAWTLSSTMTDLSVYKDGEVAHAPLDPAGPGTTKWLHHRLLRIHKLIGPVCQDRLRDSLAGRTKRVKNNGLGFDCTRLGSLADSSDPWIEPVIELLAFFGLAIFPIRGRGVDRRLGRYGDPDERQRGWQKAPGSSEPRRFVWPAWHQPLAAAGVDALLDVWRPFSCKQTWAMLGVRAGWRSVEYEARGKADPTRGIGSELL
ncbi:MAG: hypothetical protein OXI57_09220 [Rhodospirillales bacterium]|nr:hypothetical protein [Rhodospirillales bacterium]